MNKDYHEVEGAIYTGHPPICPFKVKIVNHDLPITKRVNDFIVTDEQHYVTYDKDSQYVLAISVNEDGPDYMDHTGRKSNTCESVRAYDYGKWRVFFMARFSSFVILYKILQNWQKYYQLCRKRD